MGIITNNLVEILTGLAAIFTVIDSIKNKRITLLQILMICIFFAIIPITIHKNNKAELTIDLKLAGNSLPATLSVGAKEGKINRTKNEKGDYVYSLIK